MIDYLFTGVPIFFFVLVVAKILGKAHAIVIGIISIIIMGFFDDVSATNF